MSKFDYQYYNHSINQATNFCKMNIKSLADNANITPEDLLNEIEEVKDTMLNNSEEKMMDFWACYLEIPVPMEQVILNYALKNLKSNRRIYMA